MAEHISSRLLITNLFSAISAPEDDTSAPSNPLVTFHELNRKLMLTLHVLFPNELLPALDLLDRHLVTRFHVRGGSAARVGDHGEADANAGADHSTEITTYYVRSAQQKSSSSRFHDPIATSYEIHLSAWNCSCPAFAFAAFPPTLDDPNDGVDGPELFNSDVSKAASATVGTACAVGEAVEADTWLFGGLTRGVNPPICKHLLACLLVEKCKVFSAFVEDKEVNEQEAAGWAAGWNG